MIPEIMKYVRLSNPTFQFSVLMIALLFLSTFDLIYYEQSIPLIWQYLINLVLVFGLLKLYYILNYLVFKIPNLNPLNLTITGVIVYLLIHPTTVWWMFPVVVAAMLIGKKFARYKNQPICNPAALGLFLGWVVSAVLVLFGFTQETLFVSWWGADLMYNVFNLVPFLSLFSLVLIAGLVYYAYKFRKLVHGLFFLGTYLICYSAFVVARTGAPPSAEYFVATATGSLMFLVFVMVTEPKTSPVVPAQQVWLGIAGGLLLFLFYNFFPENIPALSLEAPDIVALLLLNGLTFLVKQRFFVPGPPVLFKIR